MYPKLSATPLNDQQQFRVNKINEIKCYFIAEIKERELMSKRRSKYIASFDYFYKSLIVLFVATGRISIVSLATVTGSPLGVMIASCSVAFSITTGVVKTFLKTTGNNKKKHSKILMLSRSKLNRIKSEISKALANNKISHEDFKTIINEEKKYRESKKSIRMINSQRSNVEKNSLIEEGKKIGINPTNAAWGGAGPHRSPLSLKTHISVTPNPFFMKLYEFSSNFIYFQMQKKIFLILNRVAVVTSFPTHGNINFFR